ncbi:MAG: AAA family ATPase [Rhodocyclaceae bacterium]|nr:AAA family ATPase [Rhodocyclaceae bacterium]
MNPAPRLSLQKLLQWKASSVRLPLIMRGARQVGKTTLLKFFGATAFPAVHYLNFEENSQLATFFEPDLHPARILDELRFHLNRPINIATDLLIFDEIQACPNALTSLKYFHENLPGLAICAAGSLLGLALTPGAFPVGKVTFINLYPLTFEEFLNELNETMLVEALHAMKPGVSIPVAAHERLWECWKQYLVVGGMPAVVHAFATTRPSSLFDACHQARLVQRQLMTGYEFDMAKHSGKANAMHIARVWRSVPSQLARMQEGGSPRFRFKDAVDGARGYAQLAGPIDWLESAGLIHKAFIVETSAQPLAAYGKESCFKLYGHDTGLLGAMADLSPEILLRYGFGSYQGYVAENFVAQELKAAGTHDLYSWQNRTSEVEFLLPVSTHIYPIEVKSGTVTRAKSLGFYQEKYSPPHAVVLSGKNGWQTGARWGWPVYAAGLLRNALHTA